MKNSRDESQREVRHELRSPAVTSSEGLDVLDQRKGGMSLRTGVTQDYTRKRKRKGDRQYGVQAPLIRVRTQHPPIKVLRRSKPHSPVIYTSFPTCPILPRYTHTFLVLIAWSLFHGAIFSGIWVPKVLVLAGKTFSACLNILTYCCNELLESE